MGGGYRSGPGRVEKVYPRLFWGPKKLGRGKLIANLEEMGVSNA
jgi:hypothetical protein